MKRRHRSVLLLLSATVLTLAIYLVLLFGTGFVACGISGCSGGGFGPSYSPPQAQVGLLVCGLSLLPLAALVLQGWRRQRPDRVRPGAVTVGVVIVGAGLVVAAGTVLAMSLLQLGPNGCPLGQSRATAGPAAFSPGSATCSVDGHALPGP